MSKFPKVSKDDEYEIRRASLSEESIETTDGLEAKLRGVSRRDFLNISRRYGMTATLFAAGTMGGIFSAESLARAADAEQAKRATVAPKHVLKMGLVSNETQNNIFRNGTYEFARDLEERTDGAIQVQVLGGNTVCAEPTCIQKTVQGAIDIGMSSTQNASSLVPWLNALDWPFMFQSAGQMYHFLFNPKSEELFRKTYREKYRLEFLWAMCEPRHIFLGLKWKDAPDITSIDQLKGTKIRVTNTTMGRIALELMQFNPVPVAWVETLDALKSGLIDGAETSIAPAAAFNMAPVLSKVVVLGFIPLIEHHAINTRVLDKLGSDYTDELMEASFQAQRSTMYSNEAGKRIIIGMEPNPPKDTILGQHGVAVNQLTTEAVDAAEKMCHPSKPEYDGIRDTLNNIAGFDVYESFLPVAREYPRDGLAINVQPRRWWKSS